jgi:hypothetical protein
MIRLDDIIPVPIATYWPMIEVYARRAEIGGVSQIESGQARADNLSERQVTGQAAQLAFNLYQFGDVHAYRVSRWHADANPKKGDGGSDVPGLNLDVKGRRMRYGDDVAEYLRSGKLPVRPKERHRDFVYVLVYVRMDVTKAYIFGWLHEADLPRKVDQSGTFKGAFTVPAARVNPYPKLRWWRDGKNGAIG